MNIICENINDFCNMITTYCTNETKAVKLFICQSASYPNVAVLTTPKDHINFTYVFLTPLYTAIYSGNIPSTKYDEIYKTLENCQQQYNSSFHIEIFDKMSFNYDKNVLHIGKKLNTV